MKQPTFHGRVLLPLSVFAEARAGDPLAMERTLVSGTAQQRHSATKCSAGGVVGRGERYEGQIVAERFRKWGLFAHNGLVDTTHIAPFQNYAYLLRLTSHLQPQQISLQQNRR